MFKIDLHTHSSSSPDGGISKEEYLKMLDSNKLDYIAITDHGTIDMALNLNKKYGNRIIVGQEIRTKEGEIIGLYIRSKIKDWLSLEETINLIKEQNGIVYVPHPYEKVRSGINESSLIKSAGQIDAIEAINGRAITKKYMRKTISFANKHKIPMCASSDAHGFSGWGQCYTIVKEAPNKHNLIELLRDSKLVSRRPTIRAILYPKYNKLRKALL